MRHWIMLLLAVTLAISATGCEGSKPAGGKVAEGKALKELGKDEKATIKVLFYDKDSFFQQYGNLFISKYPNIDVDVVSMQNIYGSGKDPQKEMKKIIDEEKPDVMFIQSPDQFEQLIQDGSLYALDDVIKQDKFDVENLLPATIESLKAKGAGKLYGLSPNFYSQALFYNKDLFEKYSVPLPKNQMSWEDVMELAKRFPTDGEGDKRIYGFSPNSYAGSVPNIRYSYLSTIGTTLGLNYIDPDAMQITIQTDAWKHVLETTVNALKSGALYMPPADNQNSNQAQMYEDYLKQNLFVVGRLAMTMDGSYLMNNLRQAKDTLKDITPVNWDIVTVPVNPQNPEYSNTVSVSQIFAVNAQSTNTRAAWNFVKYINSDEYAKIMSKTSQAMLTRTTYSKEKDGHSLEPFYLLKPNPDTPYKSFEKIPVEFYQPFSTLAEQEIKAVMDGKKSADEALKTIQEKGQEALLSAKQQQDSKATAEPK